jgi:beta-N-acetylhexosaminidase
MIPMPLGPVMLDVEGTQLRADDRRRLLHPGCGGVILFARNFESAEQLTRLCAEIRALREPRLLIAADHEGGRVQRFRAGFTAVPPMRDFGRLWDADPDAARHAAEQAGYLIAAELSACGVDFSFAPVLDLDYGRSKVIGDRAFHSDPEVVVALAGALIGGLRAGGVVSVGKHFPGHGYVEADSHLDVPEDTRSYAQIEAADLVPFARLAQAGLAAVMPAHVIYPSVDRHPAGFSRLWLNDILRGRLRFEGVIFSDDLTMEGARVAGDICARAHAAFDAGCDMVLVCNKPAMTDALLQGLAVRSGAGSGRLETLHAAADAARGPSGFPRASDPRYLAARESLLEIPGRIRPSIA